MPETFIPRKIHGLRGTQIFLGDLPISSPKQNELPFVLRGPRADGTDLKPRTLRLHGVTWTTLWQEEGVRLFPPNGRAHQAWNTRQGAQVLCRRWSPESGWTDCPPPDQRSGEKPCP